MNISHSYVVGFTALAILAPFAYSLLIVLRPDAKPKNLGDYFLYGKKQDTGSFVTSSVAYSTQVASIYLFLYWFFKYGLGSLFVPFAWGLGYALVAILVRKKLLDRFLLDTSSVETLHGYIGRIFPSTNGKLTRVLVLLASISTLLGFGGSIAAEIDYATRYFLLPALGLATDQSGTVNLVIAQLLVLAFCGCYILWGGYKAAAKTDQFQIHLAYSSFTLVALSMGFLAMFTENAIVAILCTLATGYFLIDFFRRRRQLHAIEPSYSEFDKDKVMFVALILMTSLVAAVQGVLFFKAPHWSIAPSFLPPSNGNFLGFGALGVVSLVIANLFWQLIDLSCLQRLQSVEFSGTDESRNRVTRGLITSGFESFGIWVLTIVFAVLVRALSGSSDFVPDLLFHLTSPWNLLLLPALCFLVVAFMISTLACFISASAFVTYYDIVPPRTAVPAHSPILNRPRLITLLLLICFFALYWVLQSVFAPQAGQILYGFYSLQASIFVVVLVAILYPRLASVWAGILAISAGWIFGILTANSATPWFGISSDSWAVIPPLASVTASFVIYGGVLVLQWLGVKLRYEQPVD